MKIVSTAALLLGVHSDETSLMQQSVSRTQIAVDSGAHSHAARAENNKKLLETATAMIKNGVTPDVITFIDSTDREINEEVLAAIQHEHNTDQEYIRSLLAEFEAAVATLQASTQDVDNLRAASEQASLAHQECRSGQGLACARSRRCEEQLRQKWVIVRREEEEMRQIHHRIEEEWCVHPPVDPTLEAPWTGILSNDFDWSSMSPYPILNLPTDVMDFRRVSITEFTEYVHKRPIVEEAWRVYNEKVTECSELETQMDAIIEECDNVQTNLGSATCTHVEANKEARVTFGRTWERLLTTYNTAVARIRELEVDRKREWETLKIVQCLLSNVHDAVETSIETGAPCPTVDSDPDGVTQTISSCHVVTEALTEHLTIDFGAPPPVPPLPPPADVPCSPAFLASSQQSFVESLRTAYEASLESDTAYPDEPLNQYFTGLSESGWPGCAAPLVCQGCEGVATALADTEREEPAQPCHAHQEYLIPGQNNDDTFRCSNGWCLSMTGRCNGHSQCADGSDEMGCDTPWGTPAYLAESFECPADMNSRLFFQCASGACIARSGMCNGIDNCGDGSDEARCSHPVEPQPVAVEIALAQTESSQPVRTPTRTPSRTRTPTVRTRTPIRTEVRPTATSGRSITVEPARPQGPVFQDRNYAFESLGQFEGTAQVRYSNDDHQTDHSHVMTSLEIDEPMTVFIVKLTEAPLPWLPAEGYLPREESSGVTYSGTRSTAHTEWSGTLTVDSFSPSQVYERTFQAGTISVPGNNGAMGGFLMFLEPAQP